MTAAAFAATVCNEYSVTVAGVTYGDWYLPSKYELNLLYLQRACRGRRFPLNDFWSSTRAVVTSCGYQYSPMAFSTATLVKTSQSP